MSIDTYLLASPYENFMCRAFNNWDNSKPGFHMSYMQNLINAENGDTSLRKYLGSYDKQMENVKKYMTKAMDKYLQQKDFTEEQKDGLAFLKGKISKSQSTDDLLDIINKTLSMAIVAQK